MSKIIPIKLALGPETDRKKCFDNTRISQYKTCPRSYFIRHVLGWTSTGTANALIFGLSWHDSMDIVWQYGSKIAPRDLADLAHMAFVKTWKENGMPEHIPLEQESSFLPRTPGIAREMLHEYTEARAKMLRSCEIVGIEQPFAVPIPGMPNHWYIGRLDKVVDYNGQRLILEHKTTTAYATVGNFRTDYVDSWFMSSQVKGYQFGGGLYYGDINAVWVDAALVHKKVHDAFKFIPVSHNLTLLTEWIENTKQWINEISIEVDNYDAVGKLLPGMFKKNEESCFGKYGPCTYIDICRTVADPSTISVPPPGFEHKVWEPFSVLGLEKIIQENKETTNAN
jgi:hypothetical protein